jgi:large subunit ribosomal protein L21
MYAVIRTGGKQLRVTPGQSVRVERLPGDVGEAVTLGEVLLVADAAGAAAKIGSPLVAGASVVGTITAQGRGPKIDVFKMKRRKGERRHIGHRQSFTEIRIDRIEA